MRRSSAPSRRSSAAEWAASKPWQQQQPSSGALGPRFFLLRRTLDWPSFRRPGHHRAQPFSASWVFEFRVRDLVFQTSCIACSCRLSSPWRTAFRGSGRRIEYPPRWSDMRLQPKTRAVARQAGGNCYSAAPSHWALSRPRANRCVFRTSLRDGASEDFGICGDGVRPKSYLRSLRNPARSDPRATSEISGVGCGDSPLLETKALARAYGGSKASIRPPAANRVDAQALVPALSPIR
jgi:hypothetical protein